jgi:L-asparaginase/Glu-tRNA(Gln) amidotransferase subunit D
MTTTKPRVALIGTGGTISSIGRGPLDLWEYMTALMAALLGREVLTKDYEQRARRRPLVLVGSRAMPYRGGGGRVV